MNRDPENLLQAFYGDCQSAPVPASLTSTPKRIPWWIRLSVPIGGIFFGGLLAVALISAPTPGSHEKGVELARQIARRQLDLAMRQIDVPKEAPTTHHARGPSRQKGVFKEGVKWIA